MPAHSRSCAANIPAILTGVDIAVTGIPFDQAVSHRPGTRFGPEAIRKASGAECLGSVLAVDVRSVRYASPSSIMATASSIGGRKEEIVRRIEEHAAGIIDAGVSHASASAAITSSVIRC